MTRDDHGKAQVNELSLLWKHSIPEPDCDPQSATHVQSCGSAHPAGQATHCPPADEKAFEPGDEPSGGAGPPMFVTHA